MNTKILCTLGPATFNSRMIKKMDKAGVNMFRINLSHTQIDELESLIELIKANTDKPICLDTEGAQIRNGYMKNSKVELQQGDIVNLCDELDLGDEKNILLRPKGIVSRLRIGDLINIDFGTILLKVFEQGKDQARSKVLCSGECADNKAVTVNRDLALEPLSQKDKEAIKIGLKHKINFFALSFANRKEDVEYLRSLTSDSAFIISKIESKKGVDNLEEIVDASDAILIDRGDLSREEPVESIPFLQKKIINIAKANKKEVYVATNLLESMVALKKPTRAEVNDVINTLIDGASGLVLASETAIGKYPFDCVSMIKKLILSHEMFNQGLDIRQINDYNKPPLIGIEPHGNELVDRLDFSEQNGLESLEKVFIDQEELIDLEQIATGVYSPLQGFMSKGEVLSVLENNRLLSGHAWTLPVVLNVSVRPKTSKHQTIALCLGQDDICGLLDVEDIYTLDLENEAKKWFGTNDIKHPGLAKLKNKGNYFIGGKIRLLKYSYNPYRHYILTPKETRIIFEHNGWSRVVGFHTRNVPHRAHEFIQLDSLEKVDADGIFLHPVIGPKKKNDFSSQAIINCYQALCDQKDLKEKSLFSCFNTYSRYAGPREAVFTAICRKNFGCTHFIVGRDHTGVGNFYEKDASQKYFEKAGNIGIEPVFYDEVGYCSKTKDFAEKKNCEQDFFVNISGSKVRETIKANQFPDEIVIRREISKILLDMKNKGEEIFI